jgi:hypothetical protein
MSLLGFSYYSGYTYNPKSGKIMNKIVQNNRLKCYKFEDEIKKLP